jgi:hypothetical protein
MVDAVRRFASLAALLGFAVIAPGGCSEDEPLEGSGGTSGRAGAAGRANGTGGSAGEGGVSSGGSSGRASGGSSGRGQGGTQSGGSGGSGGRPPVACSSALGPEDLERNPCSQGARCSFGQECCCGECMPERDCFCTSEGTWTCGWTDFCLDPSCGGTGGSAGVGGGGT